MAAFFREVRGKVCFAYVKKNKAGFIIKVLFSFCFAAMMVLSGLIEYNGEIYSKPEDFRIGSLSAGSAAVFAAAFIISFFALCVFEVLSEHAEKAVIKKNPSGKVKTRKVFFIAAAVMLVCWLPYYLSYFPGGVYSDTFLSIGQAVGDVPWSNHHPLLYTLLIKAAIDISALFGQGMQFAMALFTAAQFVVMAGTLSYFIYWLYRKNVSRIYTVPVYLFFCFFPLVPYYAVSVWKDTPFSLAIFLYTLYLIDIVLSRGEVLFCAKGVIKYCVLGALTAFLRNNGIYIVVIATAFLLIVYRKKILKQLRRFVMAAAAVIAGTMIVQGPVYGYFELNNNQAMESYGCLMQHIAFVLSAGGDISGPELETINKVLPVEKIKENYCPFIVDTIKGDESFSIAFLKNNSGEFLKTWMSVALKNPKAVLTAHLLETLGFWDINKASPVAYVQTEIWYDRYGLHTVDYFEQATGISLDDITGVNHPISAALFVWIALASAAVTAGRKKYRLLLAYLPALILWGTIMVATPVAFSLRYVYILVLMLPLDVLLPLLPYGKADGPADLKKPKS
jgi:hypothetical protein